MRIIISIIMALLAISLQCCGLISDSKSTPSKEITDSALVTNRDWSKASGEYFLKNQMVIYSGDTMIVPPGNTIRFCKGIYIEKGAVLILDGTAEQPVSILLMDVDSVNYACDINISVLGSLIARNAIIAGTVSFPHYDDNQNIDLNHVTWVLSNIYVENAIRMIVDDPSTVIDERTEEYNTFAPRIHVTNSIISTLPNESIDSTIKLSWFEIRYSVVDPKNILISNNCIEDPTPQKMRNIYEMQLLNEKIEGYSSIFGENIIGEIEFEFYPIDGRRISVIPETWDLSVRNDENCKNLGAEN